MIFIIVQEEENEDDYGENDYRIEDVKYDEGAARRSAKAIKQAHSEWRVFITFEYEEQN